jgi:hypothetical protein
VNKPVNFGYRYLRRACRWQLDAAIDADEVTKADNLAHRFLPAGGRD